MTIYYQNKVDSSFCGETLADVSVSNIVQVEDQLQTDYITELNPGAGISMYVSGINMVQLSSSGLSIGSSGNTMSIRNDGTIRPVELQSNQVAPISIYIKNCHLTYKNENGIDINLEKSRKPSQFSVFLDNSQEVSIYQNFISGNVFVNVLNQIANSPCTNFAICKSDYTITPSISILTQNTDTNFTQIDPLWGIENELEIIKDAPTSNFSYNIDLTNSTDHCFLPVVLLGTTYVIMDSNLFGIEYYIIESNVVGGPVGQFVISKSSSTQLPTITRVCHSMGVTANTRLNVKWDPLDFPKIQKNKVNYDGQYTIKKFSHDAYHSEIINLVGTTKVPIIYRQERFSGVILVNSVLENGPTVCVSLSKNYRGNNVNVLVIARSRGVGTLERIRIEWLSNNFLKIYKDGAGYDGEYRVTFL